MGRLVQPAQRTKVIVQSGGYESAGRSETVNVGGDRYADRIAKYIPGEILAAYVALDRTLVSDTAEFNEKIQKAKDLASSAPPSAGDLVANPAAAPENLERVQETATKLAMSVEFYQWLPLMVLAVGVIFTPLYIRQLAKNAGQDTPWITQGVISTIAFILWAYSIKGSAFQVGQAAGFYDGSLAAALLVVFTLASGIFAPTPIAKNRM